MIFHGDFISNVNDHQMHERQTANEVGRLLLKASARFAQASQYKAYTIMNLPPSKAKKEARRAKTCWSFMISA